MSNFIAREGLERDYDRSLELFERAKERHEHSHNSVARLVTGAVLWYRRVGVEDSGQHLELAMELAALDRLQQQAESE